MARQRVEYLDSLRLTLRPALEEGLPLGLLGARLSHDENTGARSWLARAAPQWQRVEAGYFRAPLELIVLRGDLTVGDQVLRRGAYCHWPAGAWHAPLRSAGGCELLLMFDGEPGFTAAPAGADRADPARIDALDILAMDWCPAPAADGRSAEAAGNDLHVKMIRTDSRTGAYTLLTRQAGGWSEPRLEAHDCWEELVLLEGDYLMGTNGLVTAGTYIFRPEKIPHGPQATRTGSVWLARGNQTIDFQFTTADWADDMTREYLGAPLDDFSVDRTPWGPWSA